MTGPLRERPHRTPPRPPGSAAGRVRLDLARGVLMAWTGCDADEAFAQLVTVAALYSMTVFDLAAAVLATAHPDNTPDASPVHTAASLTAVVHRCWPEVPDPAGRTHDPS